ncbi:hypothetical protein SAMN05216570_0978 [Dyella sp. OK004]|uniref:DUF6985 domain-containing protein n=1 Tax=Dyella sp. OK004 TaxID=1855292 RepID=UPI0008F382E2|nr:hypothetical protein [Dyella sp. OK004]SFR94385.1 hypothetical protein SAMN05216570_0978 [Dyella sp. OK004]
MQIPGLGVVTKDDGLGWYISDEVRIEAFGGQACRVCVEGYAGDHDKDAFHEAIANLLSADERVLSAASPSVFAYYEDVRPYLSPSDLANLNIATPADVWSHVQFGSEVIVSRRGNGDRCVYVSIECNCDWEREHGLLIVLRGGRWITKVGPYDGHLTNSDAYGRSEYEDIVYVRI